MKLKRAKAYKKLLHQYELNFGFREPYQVLLDSSILQDAYTFKIDLLSRLQKLLGGPVKPMITTCDMRHLYAATPKNETLILQAKEYERRRCNHQDLEAPLSTLECLGEVVDPKDSGTNKNRYIVASNDVGVRKKMRGIAGVPLIYISKSVVLMEPMADATEKQREREEKSKFRAGLKGQRMPDQVQKRKRENAEEQDDRAVATEARPVKKTKRRGPKEPNPLSIKKPKKPKPTAGEGAPKKPKAPATDDTRPTTADDASATAASKGHKRKRKHKSKADTGAVPVADDADSS